MSNQFLKLRRSSVPGKVPTTSSLEFGEIALNTYDGLAFIKKSGSNGEEIITIGATSGNFTGSLFGTASWAIQALTSSYSLNIDGEQYYVAIFDGNNSVTSSLIYQSQSFTGIRSTAPTDPTNPDILLVEGSGIDTYNLISAHADRNNYVQTNVQNFNNSSIASSDVVATADNGTESTNYIDMGINSSGYDISVGVVGGQNDAYLYSTGNDLLIGNASANKKVIIFNGGLDTQANARVYVHEQGTVSINTANYNALFPPALEVQAVNATTTKIINAYANVDDFVENTIVNANAGTSASADFVAYNDLDPGNQEAGYVNMGINSTNYVPTVDYPGAAGDAYLFTDSGHLVIGPLSQSSDAKVTIFAGGTSEIDDAKLVLYGNNQHVMTGSLNASEGFTGSLYGTASWALNVLTASYVTNAVSASYAATASSADNFVVRGNLTGSNALFTGTITAQTLNVQYVTASTEFVTGSSKFGSLLTDTHQFTGSVSITSSLTVNGSLFATSSWARNALTASYVPSTAIIGDLSRIATGSVTASVGIGTASFQLNSGSSTFLFVSNSGNVGIGIATPQTILDISGSNPTVKVQVVNNSETATLSLAANDGGIRGGIIANISSGEIRMGGLRSSGYFPTFYSNNVERMRISVNGNVGIGTTTPSASLDVSGSFIVNIPASSYDLVVTGSVSGSVVRIGTDQQVLQGGLHIPKLYVKPNYAQNRAGLQISNNPQGSVYAAMYSGFGLESEGLIHGIRLDYSQTSNANDQNGNYFAIAADSRYGFFAFNRLVTTGNINSGSNGFASNLYFQNQGGASLTGSGAHVGYKSVVQFATSPILVNAASDFLADTLRGQGNGTLTNRYGLHITFTSQSITNPWGVYQVSDTVNNHFNGGVYIGTTTTSSLKLDVSGSGRFTSGLTVTGSLIAPNITGSLFGTASWAQNVATASYVTASNVYGPFGSNSVISSSYALTASFALNAGGASATNQIATGSVTASVNVGTSSFQLTSASVQLLSVSSSGLITGQRMFLSASQNTISGSTLTVYGSGSAQPVFTVQGSQGELFSVSDSLSGSLFSVNDISGLPIVEVFSDNRTLIGSYQAPALITTVRTTSTIGNNVIYQNLPTASYDGAFFDYTLRSGSNARAGQIMAVWSGSSVNFTETTTTDFGDTSAVRFGVIITGSNMALTGSFPSASWTMKTIVRSI